MNDVEHDEEAESVSLVHHVLQVVGTTITRRGSEETCHLNKEKRKLLKKDVNRGNGTSHRFSEWAFMR